MRTKRTALKRLLAEANLGLVRHSPGHVAHIHIRMTCGPSEPECVSEADFDIDAD